MSVQLQFLAVWFFLILHFCFLSYWQMRNFKHYIEGFEINANGVKNLFDHVVNQQKTLVRMAEMDVEQAQINLAFDKEISELKEKLK